MKFQIILADPPWAYDDKCLHRGGAERHYRTMSEADLRQLPVPDIAHSDSTLFLWATWPKLREALAVIDAWGFTYKTCAFVWVKTNGRAEVNQARLFPDDSFHSAWGMGRWSRSNSEFCLLGTRGKPKRQDGGVHQVIYAPVSNHSEKPGETRDRIVRLMGDIPRVELFARQKCPGWHSCGNGVSGMDIRDELRALAKRKDRA